MTNFLAFAPLGAVMIVIGVVLYGGRVGPAALYGGRAPRALRDRSAWTSATRSVGRAFVVGGVGVLSAAVVGSAFGVTLDDEVPTLLVMGLLVVAFGVGAVQALAVLRRV